VPAAAIFAGAASAQRAAPTAPLDPVKARLVAESAAIVPGKTLWVDLHLDIAPGWHTYWRNPGDSGLPTEIGWKMPPGFSAGAIAWPVPERFAEGGVGNYGYSGSTDLMVPIAVPAALDSGAPMRFEADASWLVCSDICIPGEAKLALELPVAAADATPTPSQSIATLFAAVRARLPQPVGFKAHFSVSPSELRLSLPAEAVAGVDRPDVSFFPYATSVIDAAAAPKQQPRSGGVDLVLARAGGPTATLPDTLAGVLAVRSGGDGVERVYEIEAPRGVPPGPAEEVGWWQALLLAFAGGVLLNLMPCVFPVLSLKVLGLTTSAHRAEERRHGLAYAAGVILSFTALGGVLLLLRAGGAAIGWGFQLQSPVVVGLLAYLLFAMGLSLSGVADFGGALTGVGGRFAERSGLAGAFATGVLATVVATPCTAPFMGAALGAALIAPPAVALSIFVMVGIGLAAPIVLATAVPAIARHLPRPGPWMAWFKQLLAFPLYASVAWLMWVLVQEVDPGGAFVAFLGLVTVGFAVWIYGCTRGAEPRGRRIGVGLGAAGAAAAVLAAAMLVPGSATSQTAKAAGGSLGYEPFSTARLGRLAAEHHPVFVNLTAAWCITCLVNERAALDREAVRRAFAERRVVALKGDWTRQDPEITAFLQQFGRSGVPLYLLYDKAGTPTVLPQLLSEAGVLAALEKI